jgi:hypothetical protein
MSGVVRQETIELHLCIAVATRVKQGSRSSQPQPGQCGIEAAGALVVRQGRLPHALVALELSPSQVERGIPRVSVDPLAEGNDLLMDGFVGGSGRWRVPQ